MGNRMKTNIINAFVGAALCFAQTRAAESLAVKAPTPSPLQIVLVEPTAVTTDNLASWKKEGFKGVALVLSEQLDSALLRRAAKSISAKSLELYYWIEVARNLELA